MLNKQELVNKISEVSKLSKKDTELFLRVYQDVIIDSLSDGENVKICGFGNYMVKEISEKIGKNPRTKEEVTIPKHKKISFKFGDKAKDSCK